MGLAEGPQRGPLLCEERAWGAESLRPGKRDKQLEGEEETWALLGAALGLGTHLLPSGLQSEASQALCPVPCSGWVAGLKFWVTIFPSLTNGEWPLLTHDATGRSILR